VSISIIASLTTIPSRIDQLEPVIASIRNQSSIIKSIELNIPLHCKRLNQAYDIPTYLLEDELITIFRTYDYGPITKVLPTMMRHENDPDNYIWSVDDDVVLDKKTLATLAEIVDREKPRIFSGKGGVLNKNGRLDSGLDLEPWWGYGKINWIEAYGSVLYPPGIYRNVKDTFLSLLESGDEDIIFSDDILISMVFNFAGVEIFLRNPEFPMEFTEAVKVDALHDIQQYSRYNRAYDKIMAFYNVTRIPLKFN